MGCRRIRYLICFILFFKAFWASSSLHKIKMAEYSNIFFRILFSYSIIALVESLPTELNCRVHKMNVSSAARWADCVMGEIWSFRCRNTTVLAKKWNSAGQKKYRLSRFEKYNFRPCGNAKQGSVGRSAVEICHRVTKTNGDNFLFVSSLINVATFLSPFLRRGATIFYLQLLICFISRNQAFPENLKL